MKLIFTLKITNAKQMTNIFSTKIVSEDISVNENSKHNYCQDIIFFHYLLRNKNIWIYNGEFFEL